MNNFHLPKDPDVNELRLDTANTNELWKQIEKLNQHYKKRRLGISVGKYSFDLAVDRHDDYDKVSDFFFYPVARIYAWDGQTESDIGYRIRFIKRKSNKWLISVSLNFPNKALMGSAWLNDNELTGFKLKKGKVDVDKLMDATLQLVARREVYTGSVGWVKGGNDFHYVPITDFMFDDIHCDDDIIDTFAIEPQPNLDGTGAFNKIHELLSVTDKSITIPLLSFTVVSSLLSLIVHNNDEHPGFILNLYGGGEKHSEALANLFCNIYHISPLIVLDTTPVR